MTTAECYELMIDGPDVHCPKCETPLLAWNWGGQVLYTCSGCDVLGFNLKRAGIDIDSFRVVEIVDGAQCKGCSDTLERRDAPNVDFFTCPGCDVGLFTGVTEIRDVRVDVNDPNGCDTHKEMRVIVGNAYDELILHLR